MVVGSASGWMASVPGLAPGGRCLKDRLRSRFHMFVRLAIRADCSRLDEFLINEMVRDHAKELAFLAIVVVCASVVELRYEHGAVDFFARAFY